MNAVLAEGFGESDPAHSTLLSAATSGSPPAGPAQKRALVRMPFEADASPGSVTVEFKRPWSDGTRSIGLAPHALLSRMAALVSPPKRHVTVYSGVLASNSPWRRLIIPKTEAAAESQLLENAVVGGLPAMSVPGPASATETKPKPKPKPKPGGRRYIPWHRRQGRALAADLRRGG